LELLDQITKLKYNNKLPKHINGNFHNTIIHQFQLHNDADYIPDNIPQQLKWTLSDPMDLLLFVTDSPWQIVQAKSKKTNKSLGKTIDINNGVSVTRKNDDVYIFVVANGTVSVPTGLTAGVKQKADSEESIIRLCQTKESQVIIFSLT
jgi:hypothetical protein